MLFLEETFWGRVISLFFIGDLEFSRIQKPTLIQEAETPTLERSISLSSGCQRNIYIYIFGLASPTWVGKIGNSAG